MNNLQIFKGHKVEIIEFENKILFNPYDVGKCLELEKSTIRRAIQGMNEKQVIKLTNSVVQNMNTRRIPEVNIFDFRKLNNAGENFLTESGVYKLIFKSNKPKAEEFANWVTDEVLPSIRKTGNYAIQNNDIIQMLVVSQKIS
jgi:prophage antirepressor